MPDAIWEFDALASNVDGTNPGAALTVSTGNYLVEQFSAPAPPAKFQWAGSVDTEGSALASRGHENRTINLTIKTATEAAQTSLQDKLAKIHREGGTLKYTNRAGVVRIFDLLATEGFEPQFDVMHYASGHTISTISLPAKPYARGTEQDLGDNVETTLPALVFTETSISGDVPALGRLVIDDDSGQTQYWLTWGLEQRNYSSAATAALFYEAESRFASGATAVAGPAGASGAGSNVMRHTNLVLAPSTSDLFFTASSAAAEMTHVGTFRVYARVHVPTANTGTVSIRLRWGLAEYINRIANAWVPITVENSWQMADLGLIHIPQPRAGNPIWMGRFEANSTVAGDDIDVDSFFLVPAAEGSGVAQGVSQAFPDGAIFASQSMQLRHDAVIRENSGGTAWGITPNYQGDFLLVPPSGAEARTVRFIVKASRGVPLGTPGTLGDPNIDDISARLFVTPRYLVV